jgi:hypothetical protein
MSSTSDLDILITSRLWVGTPWDYSSSRWLRFKSEENSDCCYGYGQTIYAVINFRFSLSAENTIKLDYLESPAVGNRFVGFEPSSNNQAKEISYHLKQKEFTGWKNITGQEFKYHWILTLSESPFPYNFEFPYEIPLIYYGHRKC